jgi:hypothetical protein
MKHVGKTAALALVLIGAIAAPATAAPLRAGAPAPAATTSCSATTAKVTADWLRVHTNHSVSSPVVGQVPYGSYWHYCAGTSGAWDSTHTYYWIYGYGYNGSTKLTGWVDSEYLLGP